jgi:hypothetical protein
MDEAWPPPSIDDDPYGRRAPNYALRRAVVLIAVVAVVAVVAFVVFGRGDDDGDDGGTTASGWDVVVVQQSDGTVTVHDADGDELLSVESELVGVDDVGIAGAVVLGLDGDPVADGLGVLDLDGGGITDIEVSFDEVRRLGRSSLLVSFPSDGAGLELVVPADARTIDLVALADGSDPVVDPRTVQVDDAGALVAFDELRNSATVVVDVAAETGTSLPGALVDLAFGRVLTVTNRGETVLLDLSEPTGERVGTVETPRVVAAMLVDASTAIVVTAEGLVSRVDFGDERVEEVVDLAPVLPVPPGADPAVDTEIVQQGVAMADRTRLALFGERYVAFLDEAGELVRSVDVPMRQQPRLDLTGAERCITVGADSGPATLLDGSTGAIVTAFAEGTVVAGSVDGCVVAVTDTTSGVVSGLEVDRSVDGAVVALSDDGSATVQTAARSAELVAVDDDTDPVELVDRRATSAAFARR